MTWKLEIGYRSDVGRVRELNEDSFLALTPPALVSDLDAVLAVADGMGGHDAGEVASDMAVRLLDQWFVSGEYSRQVPYSPSHPDYYVVVLKELLGAVNDEVYRLASHRDGTAGMGTTVTVALAQARHLIVGHVGDSRAYLLRGDRLLQLTQDHTWVAEQWQAGRLSPAEAACHPRRHVLTRALGQGPLVRVDAGMHELLQEDTLLLCSDGLSSLVPEDAIRQTLASAPNAQAACHQLVAWANHRGGTDNISVLVVRFRSREGSDSVSPGPARVVGPRQRHRVVSSAFANAETVAFRRAGPVPYRKRLIVRGSLSVLSFLATVLIGTILLRYGLLTSNVAWSLILAASIAGTGGLVAVLIVAAYRHLAKSGRNPSQTKE